MNMKDYIKEDNLRMQRIKDIIDLIMLMQSRTQGISLAEIQEEFEVSRRTAQRMKDVVINLYPDKVVELQENSKIVRCQDFCQLRQLIRQLFLSLVDKTRLSCQTGL